MSKRKHRRRFRRLVRVLAVACAAIVMMSWGLGLTWGGVPVPFLVLGTLSALIVVPALLLVLVVTTAAVAAPFAIMAAIFGAPFYLIHRLTRGAGSSSREDDDDRDVAAPARSEEALLRRRYVAGELTYQQFQSGMVGLLKERFARGDLGITAYEAELEKLLQPARHLDAAHDPTLAAAIRP